MGDARNGGSPDQRWFVCFRQLRTCCSITSAPLWATTRLPRCKISGTPLTRHCDGTLDRIHHVLYVECREKAERQASPTACIIDSQSVKSAEKGGPALILTGSTLEIIWK